MTTEEALRILDPETTREALAEYEYFGGFRGSEAGIAACDEACRVACAALRARQTPAKLDRSQWDGCDRCNLELYKHTGVDGSGVYFQSQIPETDTFLYCPRCGRPLTEEAWAELERRIGGNDGTAD